jgi:hypothetical protein
LRKNFQNICRFERARLQPSRKAAKITTALAVRSGLAHPKRLFPQPVRLELSSRAKPRGTNSFIETTANAAMNF